MTFQELRQQMYEKIVDEAIYISRASEGAVSVDWVMQQPIFIRKKYYKQMQEEIQKREEKMNRHKKATGQRGSSYTKNSRSIDPSEIAGLSKSK